MTFHDLLTTKGFGPYRKSGSRYVGPCPICGGSSDTTRFVTKADSDTGKCFSCGWVGDSVKLLRQLDNLTCKEAHAALGRECCKPSCPAWDKCTGTRTARRPGGTSVAVPSAIGATSHTPADPRTPGEIWQAAAGKLVETAHQRLLDNPSALDYLAQRGLDRQAVIEHRLGWLEGEKGKPCIFRPRSTWGLPTAVYTDGPKKGQPKLELWIPRGIVIPSFVGATIDRIRIRRPNGDIAGTDSPKYLAIEGGGNSLVSLNPAARAQLVVESDLDALLLDHLAGDIVGTIPLTTCTVRPDSGIAAILREAAIILVGLDSDPVSSNVATHRTQGGGPVNAIWWQRNYPQAVRWPVPVGKDPGEAYQHGTDLRAWVLTGLPISLHPRQEAPAPVVEPIPPTEVRTETWGKHTIHYPETPEDWRRLTAEGAIMLGPKELEIIDQAAVPSVVIDKILPVKAIFPGAYLAGFIPKESNACVTA